MIIENIKGIISEKKTRLPLLRNQGRTEKINLLLTGVSTKNIT